MEIEKIEQHLYNLDRNKRIKTIDAYSRVIAKFQK